MGILDFFFGGGLGGIFYLKFLNLEFPKLEFPNLVIASEAKQSLGILDFI